MSLRVLVREGSRRRLTRTLNCHEDVFKSIQMEGSMEWGCFRTHAVERYLGVAANGVERCWRFTGLVQSKINEIFERPLF